MSTVEPYASPNGITYQGRDFTEDEALRLTADIKAWAGTLWVRLEAARNGRAWKALGYTSWADYLETEFEISRSRGYQLVAHAAAVRELAEAAGLEVSTAVDIPERHTRAIDTTAAAADIAAAVAAEPDADEARRAEIVEQTITEHKVTATTTTTIDADTAEILDTNPSTEDTAPPAEAPVDDAPRGTPAPDGAPEGGGAEGSDPTPSENDPPAPVQDSPELLRAKAVKRHGDLMQKTRDGLLLLSPIDVSAHCPIEDRDDWLAFAGQLADFAERLATEFAPQPLRSVQ